MSRNGFRRLFAAGVAVLLSVALIAAMPPVRACPVCDSATGRQVRAGIFNGKFGYNLALTLLPFPIFLGIVAVTYYGLPLPWPAARRRRPEQEEDERADAAPEES